MRNGGVTCKFKVLSSFNVCPRGQWRLRKPTTEQTQTLAVMLGTDTISKMEEREIIIKVSNDRIYLNPTLFIPIEQTSIPKKHLTFRSHEDIFWKVEMLAYQQEKKCLKVSVKDYSASDIARFNQQVPKKSIELMLFDRFDWTKLEPLLTYYHKSQLAKFLFNSDTSPLLKDDKEVDWRIKPATNPSTFSQYTPLTPTVSRITEDFWVHFTDSSFMLGYVTFRKHIKKIGRELDFKIPNEHILAEFDNIKFWFAKKLKTKKFKVVASLTLSDNEIIETKVSSQHIDQITSELIDSVKYQRTFALTKDLRIENPDKSLFTADEIFSRIDTDDKEGNVFNQSEEDILNFFLENSKIRNKKQLAYLAGKKQSENHKLCYTLNPNFGFLFLIEGVQYNHFVWELLNSHATYIWSIEKGIQNMEFQFKRIEMIVNTVRTSGRENYKRAYRNNHQDNDLVFRVISHKAITSKLVDDFPDWKSRLNEQLT